MSPLVVTLDLSSYEKLHYECNGFIGSRKKRESRLGQRDHYAIVTKFLLVQQEALEQRLPFLSTPYRAEMPRPLYHILVQSLAKAERKVEEILQKLISVGSQLATLVTAKQHLFSWRRIWELYPCVCQSCYFCLFFSSFFCATYLLKELIKVL